jgi:hypothetical protein
MVLLLGLGEDVGLVVPPLFPIKPEAATAPMTITKIAIMPIAVKSDLLDLLFLCFVVFGDA